jgi:hypothetical protein
VISVGRPSIITVHKAIATYMGEENVFFKLEIGAIVKIRIAESKTSYFWLLVFLFRMVRA